jgi:hypothetical protein
VSEATTAAFASHEALLEERHRSVEAALREQAPRSETPELLDATPAADATTNAGQDLEMTSFVAFAGIEAARPLATERIAASQESLRAFAPAAQPLRDLARHVLARRRE